VGFVLVCAVVAAGMGYVRGREKAFTLKWQAQQALCLMHTERSTRFVAVSVSRRSAEAVLHSDRPAEQGTTSDERRSSSQCCAGSLEGWRLCQHKLVESIDLTDAYAGRVTPCAP